MLYWFKEQNKIFILKNAGGDILGNGVLYLLYYVKKKCLSSTSGILHQKSKSNFPVDLWSIYKWSAKPKNILKTVCGVICTTED